MFASYSVPHDMADIASDHSDHQVTGPMYSKSPWHSGAARGRQMVEELFHAASNFSSAISCLLLSAVASLG